jgi:hypothetical protein
MSKLEEVMDDQDANFRKAAAAHNAAEAKRKKSQQRQERLFERKEFNRLFKKLRGMVEGHWDRYGNGWKFKYKGGDFYIAYEHWFSPKTAGDADDYDMEGDSWVLKLGFNGIQGRTVTIAQGWDRYSDKPKKDYTDDVMTGLRELGSKFADSKGRFYGDDGESEEED